MINTSLIIGEAGTAKSTTILKTVETLDNFVCLAFTHSAVNNLRSKSTKNKDRFKTIHSFLRIKIDENGDEIIMLNQRIDVPEYIFIDEISLVPINLLHTAYTIISNNIYKFENRTINIILVGDLLQLNPVSNSRFLIDYHKLFDVPNIKLGFQEAMLIGDHLSNNIFSTEYYKNARRLILTKNYRSNDAVLKVLNSVLEDVNTIKDNMIAKESINSYIKKGYIILSSTYKNLEYVKQTYDYINLYQNKEEVLKNYGIMVSREATSCPLNGLNARAKTLVSKPEHEMRTIRERKNVKELYEINTLVGKIKFSDGDFLLLTEILSRDFLNGDIVKLYKNNSYYEIVNLNSDEPKKLLLDKSNIYPLLPLNYITIHKSQSLSLNKVLVILDDLFEITMLYTAITRAKKSIKFTCLNKLPIEKLKLYTNAFNKLKSIIYPECESQSDIMST